MLGGGGVASGLGKNRAGIEGGHSTNYNKEITEGEHRIPKEKGIEREVPLQMYFGVAVGDSEGFSGCREKKPKGE